MPVTPITPAQIDEVGKGACLTAPDHSAKPEPEDGLGPTGECSSRGPADDDAEINRILAMSEEELRADLIAQGRDPDEVVAGMRRELSAAISLAEERNRLNAAIWSALAPFVDELVATGGVTFMGLRNAVAAAVEPFIEQHRSDAVGWHVKYKQARREKNAAFAAANPSGGMGNVTGASLDAWELAEERKRSDLFVSKLNEAEGYATRLAQSLSDKHFPNPNWRPLPGLYGVLTQIDNMTTGMSRKSDPPSVSDRSGEAVETTGSTEGKSTADLSATPEATPSIPSPPSPRKGQEENPCPMTVEEAKAVLATLPRYGLTRDWIDWWRRRAEHMRGDDKAKCIARANQVELALSTIRASEEDR